MFLLIAVAALVMSSIAFQKHWDKLKIVCYLIAFVLFVLEAIKIWVSNFSAL